MGVVAGAPAHRVSRVVHEPDVEAFDVADLGRHRAGQLHRPWASHSSEHRTVVPVVEPLDPHHREATYAPRSNRLARLASSDSAGLRSAGASSAWRKRE
jgi:hypothetical protein